MVLGIAALKEEHTKILKGRQRLLKGRPMGTFVFFLFCVDSINQHWISHSLFKDKQLLSAYDVHS